MKRLYVMSFFVSTVIVATPISDWTWTYRFNLQKSTRVKPGVICVSKEGVPSFNQLLFSWNAYRPEHAFSCFVSVRDAGSKKWSQWYLMTQWGKDKQLSHKSREDDPYSYVYVRLETASHPVDGFRIKIELDRPQDESLLKSCSICTSDLTRFAPENIDQLALPSVHVPHVPKISQFELEHPKKDALCSPTSCAMLVGYLSKKTPDPLAFAQGVFDAGLGVYGSWPFNTAHAFEMTRGSHLFEVTRMGSFAQVHGFLQKKIPVIVSVRGPLVGSATPYAGGHLLLVVGWDNTKKEVICHDPAFASAEHVEKRYPVKDFLHAWERSRRLAYTASRA